ncbi:hypothetical protein JHK84_043759 [Glycine max]|nr:hypothetical protein JHK84_043759 [Glycine max]
MGTTANGLQGFRFFFSVYLTIENVGPFFSRKLSRTSWQDKSCPIYKDQCNNSALSTKQWSSFPAKSKNVP